jgi:subtilase family serine protease
VAAVIGLYAVGLSAAVAGASAPAPRATAMLTGSVAPAVADARAGNAVSGREPQTIEVWMAGREHAAQRFVQAVSTPGSAAYQRFLSPVAYTQRFGPTAGQVRAVRSFLSAEGFSRVRTSTNDDYVSATAPTSTLDQAFSVRMRRYQLSGAGGQATSIESNDRALTVPASISGDILAVTGLNTTPPVAAASTSAATTGAGAKARDCSRYWAQKATAITPAFDGVTQAAIAVCGYTAKQIRAAYGLTSANTGAGETIAIVGLGAPTEGMQTLVDIARANGLRTPHRDQYRLQTIGHGTRRSPCIDEVEEGDIDSDAVFETAPSANQLLVYACDTGKNGMQRQLEAELAPLTGHGTHPPVSVESNSYTLSYGGERSVPPSERRVSHAIALRAAAEGVSLLVASQDTPGVFMPSADPDVTAVGGTTLGIGAKGQRLFETGWSTLFGGRTGTSGSWQDEGIDGAGGGPSAVYREPSYQTGVVPSALSKNSLGHPARTVPDISADADPHSGLLFGYVYKHRYLTFEQGGTSTATPLVAGIVADAEQGQPSSFGFLNPRLYSLAGSPAFHDILPVTASTPAVDRAFEVSEPTRVNGTQVESQVVGVIDAQGVPGTNQVTALGYDTMTGLGSPNGAAFIKGLRSRR